MSPRTVIVVLAALTAFGSIGAAVAQSKDAKSGAVLPIRTQWKMTVGGQLYDNWPKVLSTSAPAETHPSYPKTGKQKGGTTWRCTECHGWDYRGVEGAYGDTGNVHYTGIKGITGAAGMPLETIVRILRGRDHRYTKAMIDDTQMEKLAIFVRRGQIDMAQYIDPANGATKGDPANGKYLFEVVCSRCHGNDGRWINFRTASNPRYIGTMASANPWQVVHKARYGQPGAGMVSYGEFFERYASDTLISPADIADVVAYAQTLPQR